MELILISICSLLVFLYFYFLRVDSRTRELSSKFPGPKPLPILGNLFVLNAQASEMTAMYNNMAKLYPGKCLFWMGERPILCLYNTKDIEVVLSSSTQIDKSYEYHFFHDWLGKGLQTSTGDKWRSRRKMFNGAFNYRLLEMFLEVFNNKSAILIGKFDSAMEKGSFDVFQYISLCTLDVLCDTMLGENVDAQHNADSTYIAATDRMESIFLKRQYNIFLWPDFIFHQTPLGKLQKKTLEVIHGFSEKVIKDKQNYENHTKNNNHQNDDQFLGKKQQLTLLDILLQARKTDDSLTDLEIRNETDTFMAAGNDSLAAGLSWTVFLLGSHPDIQKKAQAEIDQIFGNNRKRNITMDDLKKLKYLESVIKESHRLIPPVPIIMRELNQDTIIDGKTVPAGMTILIQIYLMHHNETAYPEPEVFNPDRFLAESNQQPSAYSFIPFSAGPRNCIGQKYSIMLEKVILAHIIRNFSLESVHKMDEIVFTGQMTIRSEQGMVMSMKKR